LPRSTTYKNQALQIKASSRARNRTAAAKSQALKAIEVASGSCGTDHLRQSRMTNNVSDGDEPGFAGFLALA
jgi:hypothetical protein